MYYNVEFLDERDTKSDEELLEMLDEHVRKWFLSKFDGFTPPQKFSIPAIHNRQNILISSPTGSGKTLSAFLSIINELVFLAKNNILEDKVYAIYVSPLKALNNDIEKNLQGPLKEILDIIKQDGIEMQEIRIGKRTGDVTSSERAKQLKKPPHILITTPESLSIVLVAPKFSQLLQKVEYVIVDEIHALAENKRGTHLALSLERLARHNEFTRIGLSATVSPLEEVAMFLVGNEERHVKVVDVSYMKKTWLYVYSPVEDLINVENEKLQERFYALLDKLIEKHRTTLIFTNTRAGTEKIVHHLKTKFKDKYEDLIEAHHGSLSREHRLEVEKKLKEGKLKCVVTSTSLELGIDIGYVDLVVLIGSPKSIARALQRVGRAGHRLHETSKGVFIALNRDDLVEVSVMAKEALNRNIDRVKIVKNALDVLAQHIVGMALEKKWNVDEAYELIRKSYPYRDLPKEDYLSVIRYLSGYYHDLEENNVYAKIWYDEETNEFGKKGRNIRMIYYTNVGTIPDEAMIKVVDEENNYVGKVEEDFAEKLLPGDRFVLGGKVYEFVGSRGAKIRVKKAFDEQPTIPAWFSEMLPLSYDLALKINEFRAEIKHMLKTHSKEQIVSYIKDTLPVSHDSAEMIYEYFYEQDKYLEIPTLDSIVIEQYVDEKLRQNFIFHTLFGRRTNDALSRAYAYVITHLFRTNVGITVDDNGFVLTLPYGRRINIERVLEMVDDENIEKILVKAIENTELVKRRFRQVAVRGLLVLRQYAGKYKSVGRQLISSWQLYKILVENVPDFPLLKETNREILEDVMDIEHAKEVLKNIKIKKWKYKLYRNLELPSPFAHNLILLGDSDVVLMANKRELLKVLHRQILRRIEGGG